MKEFNNKVVVITGAAGGIGKALTARFLEEGANVYAVDISKEKLEELNDAFDAHENLFTVVTDISKEESTHALSAKLNRKWSKADVLINNAGWFPFTDFEDIDYTEWRNVLSINLDGPFLMMKAFLPLLKKSNAGRIINLGSGSFFSPPPNQAHYVAAKAGVIGLTRASAMSLGEYDITVNAVTPGLTSTPSLEEKVPEDMIDRIAANGALKRRQKADDLVGTIVFLASDDASFITGQTINVDGGRSFI